MKNIGWGFIGCGEVTEKKSGPAFNEVKGSHVVAVMSRNAEKAKSYAKRHGISKWYTDPQELIDDPDVTAVYIATQTCLYREAFGSKLRRLRPYQQNMRRDRRSLFCRLLPPLSALLQKGEINT